MERSKGALDDDLFLDFENATHIMVGYDAEYVEDRKVMERCGVDEFGIRYGLMQDLEIMGCRGSDLRKYREILNTKRSNLNPFIGYLVKRRPDLFTFENARALRAVKIAYHLNKWGMRKRFFKFNDGESMDPYIEKAIAREPVFTKRLKTLRFHHCLIQK